MKYSKDKNVIEMTPIVDYSDPEQIPRPSNLPAIASPEVTRLKENLDLDRKLSLNGQAKLDASALVDNDIESILQGSPYEEVNKAELETLFVQRLDKKLAWFNHVQKFTPAYKKLLHTTLATAIVYASTVISHNYWDSVIGWTAPIIISAICAGVVYVCFQCFYLINLTFETDAHVSYIKANVSLKLEDVSDTVMKIPYGAKLRLSEAHDSGLFDSFMIAYPDVVYHNVEKKKPRLLTLDPAIIGVKQNKVSRTEKWFMIVYWDIPKDIDATERKIKQLHKYKLT